MTPENISDLITDLSFLKSEVWVYKVSLQEDWLEPNPSRRALRAGELFLHWRSMCRLPHKDECYLPKFSGSRINLSATDIKKNFTETESGKKPNFLLLLHNTEIMVCFFQPEKLWQVVTNLHFTLCAKFAEWKSSVSRGWSGELQVH